MYVVSFGREKYPVDRFESRPAELALGFLAEADEAASKVPVRGVK
jgi:hypothetical protein